MPHHDDEIDDIMSSILQRQGRPSQKQHVKFRKKNRQNHQPAQSQRHPDTQAVQAEQLAVIPTHETYKTLGAQAQAIEKSMAQPRRKKYKLKKSVKISIILLLTFLALGGLGFFYREQIGSAVSDLFVPQSPFSDEIKTEYSFPLYYPTDLPEGYKLDKDSIRQPDEGVLIYAVTDDTGKSVNFTMQDQPSDLNLDPLYAVLKDVREINTPLGPTKAGTTTDDKIVANTLTGETWVLVNIPVNTISNEEFDALLRSLKRG